jgi:hypothetical protein
LQDGWKVLWGNGIFHTKILPEEFYTVPDFDKINIRKNVYFRGYGGAWRPQMVITTTRTIHERIFIRDLQMKMHNYRF